MPSSSGGRPRGTDGPGVLLVGASVFAVLLLTLFPYNFSDAFPRTTVERNFLALPRWRDAADTAANFLFFLPVGWAVARGVARRARAWSVGISAAAAFCFGLSATVEFLQTFLPSRLPSAIDLVVNTAGGVFGAALLGRWNLDAAISMLNWGHRRLAPWAGMVAITAAGVSLVGAGVPAPFLRTDSVADWNASYFLVAGNETTGDRPWDGRIRRVEMAAGTLEQEEAGAAFGDGLGPTFGDRVLASYHLDIESGDPLQDRANRVGPLVWAPPEAAPPEATRAQGAAFDGTSWLQTPRPASNLTAAVQAAGQFTISLICTPTRTLQAGPARILSLSLDTAERNLTVGQESNDLVVRIRTPTAGMNGSGRTLVVPEIFQAGQERHLLITYDGYHATAWIDRPESRHDIELGLGPGSWIARHLFSARVADRAQHEALYRLGVFLPVGLLAGLAGGRKRGTRRVPRSLFLAAAILGPPLFLEMLWAGLQPRPFSFVDLVVATVMVAGAAVLVFLTRAADGPVSVQSAST